MSRPLRASWRSVPKRYWHENFCPGLTPIGDPMKKSRIPSPPLAPTDRIVDKSEIVDIVGLSVSTIYRLERKDPPGFPHRLVLSRQRTGWRLSEVMSWLAGREQRSLGRFTNFFYPGVAGGRGGQAAGARKLRCA